jgi:hypothetical protein
MLNRTAGTSAVSLTLSWDGNSGGVTNLTKLRVAHWNGTKWVNEGNGGTSGDTLAGTVTSSSAITSFSPFTLSSSNSTNPLPVEIINFSASKKTKAVELNWTVATEIGVKSYSIEKSKDGKNFNEVVKLNATAQQSSIKNYSCTDQTPSTGISYYRLKSLDINNSFKYSKLVPVSFINSTDFKIYPTLVSENLFINAPTKNKEYHIEIYNLTGMLVFNTDINIDNSSVNISNLEKGIYFVKVSSETEKYTSRIIKQ